MRKSSNVGGRPAIASTRKTAGEIASANLALLPPSAGLSAVEVAKWQEIVGGAPLRYFTPMHRSLLEQYVRALLLSERMYRQAGRQPMVIKEHGRTRANPFYSTLRSVQANVSTLALRLGLSIHKQKLAATQEEQPLTTAKGEEEEHQEPAATSMPSRRGLLGGRGINY